MGIPYGNPHMGFPNGQVWGLAAWVSNMDQSWAQIWFQKFGADIWVQMLVLGPKLDPKSLKTKNYCHMENAIDVAGVNTSKSLHISKRGS